MITAEVEGLQVGDEVWFTSLGSDRITGKGELYRILLQNGHWMALVIEKGNHSSRSTRLI